MTDERMQRVVQQRHYCTDRLAEVKEDIVRFQNEAVELKTKLETTVGEIEAGQIRRRRRYLSRRVEELKVERTARTTEHQSATDQLNNIMAETESNASLPAVPESG